MTEKLFDLDEALRAEADELLDAKGLRALLEEYGTVHVTGSYMLRLMVWRDLDIMLEAPDMTIPKFFELGQRVTALLTPWKMFFTNNRDFTSHEYPAGLYWGGRLGDLRKGAWKIDLWSFDAETCQSKVAHCLAIKSKLTRDNRRIILDLKSQLWDHAEYRKGITSQDIYDAVLDAGVTDVGGFWRYVEHRSGSQQGTPADRVQPAASRRSAPGG